MYTFRCFISSVFLPGTNKKPICRLDQFTYFRSADKHEHLTLFSINDRNQSWILLRSVRANFRPAFVIIFLSSWFIAFRCSDGCKKCTRRRWFSKERSVFADLKAKWIRELGNYFARYNWQRVTSLFRNHIYYLGKWNVNLNWHLCL